jgi:4-hydroxy-3-methylbut-2-enyl diphosphate reductase
VARRCGTRAEVLDDAGDLDLSWLDGASTVGLTAGASAPEHLVRSVIDALRGLGPLDVEERSVTTESVAFPLPVEVR